MADVFISYHKSADAIVSQIVNTLENTEISCWYDGRDMKPAEEFAGSITRAIRECRVFLLVLNQEAFRSAHVQSEVAMALRRIVNYESLTFLPFQVDNSGFRPNSELSYYLGRFQILDGCPPDTRHIRELGNRVARILKREKLFSSSPSPS